MNPPYIKICAKKECFFVIFSYSPREIAEWQTEHWEETGHKFFSLRQGKRVVS